MALLVTLAVSMLSFALLYLSGDPAAAIAGETANAEDIEAVRVYYGFDRPWVVQYGEWMFNAIRGDFGESYYFKLPVSQLVAERLSVTMLLSVMGQAMPSFWFGLVLIVLFSIKLRILPPSGSDSWQNFVMPTIVLGYYAMPAIMRLTRAGMLDVLGADYVRTARAKGAGEFRVMFKHALRNAIIPVVSLAAVQMGFMLGGSIVVESIFALHGAGYLAWESIGRNDLPTVQALILVFSMFYIVFTFLSDLLNAWLDPRMRVG